MPMRCSFTCFMEIEIMKERKRCQESCILFFKLGHTLHSRVSIHPHLAAHFCFIAAGWLFMIGGQRLLSFIRVLLSSWVEETNGRFSESEQSPRCPQTLLPKGIRGWGKAFFVQPMPPSYPMFMVWKGYWNNCWRNSVLVSAVLNKGKTILKLIFLVEISSWIIISVLVPQSAYITSLFLFWHLVQIWKREKYLFLLLQVLGCFSDGKSIFSSRLLSLLLDEWYMCAY